jgi:serine/threonine-protein kinase
MPSDSPDKGGKRTPRLGKYEILGHIATGGMGAVYKAHDPELGRDVALKVLSPELAVKPVMLERFRREARSAAKLRHDNIVAIFEFGEASGTYFLALEYVDGIDLHEYVSQRKRLSPEEARDFLTQAARALGHLYANDIVHRDVKPSNFLIAALGERKVLKLTDLGLARETSDDEFRVTRAGTTVGTVDYMAPEQARDSGSADIRSDLYSLGCTFFFVLAGNPPFPDGSLTERIYKHVEAEPPDLRKLNPDVPAGLAAIIRRMLEKKPEDRFQTPDELIRALESPECMEAYRFRPAERKAVVKARSAPQSPVEVPRVRTKRPSSAEAETPRIRTKSPSSSEQARVAGKSGVRATVGKRRLRDDDDAAAVKSETDGGLPVWLPVAAGVAALVVLAVAGWLLLGPSGDTPKTGPVAKKNERPGPELKKKGSPDKPVEKEKEPPPPKDELLSLYGPGEAPELAAVQAEFKDALGPVPQPPPGSPVHPVARFARPGDDSVRSLADACARAAEGKHTVIEICDNGPLFEPVIGPLGTRQLTVRAGKGFRPLIAWDVADGRATEFLALEKGSLTLENLDFVVRWANPRGDEAPRLFRVTEGTFAAQDCTFSFAGQAPQGVVLARLDGGSAPVKGRLSRCFARGNPLIAAVLTGPASDLLIDGCLLTGESQPLVIVGNNSDKHSTVRVFRSTLVSGGSVFKVEAPTSRPGAPRVQWRCWDALLARCGPSSNADMLQLPPLPGCEEMSWRAVNCLYAGWESLVTVDGKAIAARPLDGWRALWRQGSGDKALLDAWPGAASMALENSPPESFLTKDTLVCYAATAGPGPLGCDLKSLPSGRASWLGLTYEKFVSPPLLLPDGDAPQVSQDPPEGVYAGETLELKDGLDLGKHLAARLLKAQPAEQVVLRLSGTGSQETSPLRLKGVNLKIYFEPPAKSAKPLVLVPNPKASANQDALLDVDGGSVDLIGVRMRIESKAGAGAPQRLLRVRNGDLRLFGCELEGPLSKLPANYQGLIEFHGSGKAAADAALGCAVNQSVLTSGKNVLRVQGTGARVRFHQSAVVAAHDGLRFDLGGKPGPQLNVQCLLQYCTFAVRNSVFVVASAPALPGLVEPLVLQAEHNLFADPFSDMPRQSSLLRLDGDVLSRGLVHWQGNGNGYDEKRLHAFVVHAEQSEPGRQRHEVWARLWGTSGEQKPVQVTWPATAIITFPAERPVLDRLRLPRDSGWALGADLNRVGAAKGK